MLLGKLYVAKASHLRTRKRQMWHIQPLALRLGCAETDGLMFSSVQTKLNLGHRGKDDL